MKQLRILLLLLISLNGYCQANVNLDVAPSNATGLTTKLNDPLYNHANKIVPFTMVVVSILFILAAFQIYNKMIMGEEKVIGMIARWMFGILLFISLMTFLNAFISKQDFNRTAPKLDVNKL